MIAAVFFAVVLCLLFGIGLVLFIVAAGMALVYGLMALCYGVVALGEWLVSSLISHWWTPRLPTCGFESEMFDALSRVQTCTRDGDCITGHGPCNGWPRVADMEDFHARRRAVGAE